jgi:hypothetical protein
MTPAPAVKRASVPRNKAAPLSTGQVNGAAANVTPARPPEKIDVQLQPDVPEHPYGDREVFVWRPKGGGDPIVLPHINTVKTTQEFFATIYDLNEMFQSFEWLILAGVPKNIRLQVARLGDTDAAEQSKMFTSWFAPITRPQGGEPPGES